MRQVLFTFVLFIPLLPANATEWQSVPDSDFTFEVTIEGVSTTGRFGKYDVRFNFDPDHPDASELRVSVDLRAADLGDPDMNSVLFDPAWFDVERFPVAVFRCEEITSTAPGNFVARGTLELKGGTRTVEVPLTWSSDGTEARMRGRFALRRTDFDVGSGEWSSDEYIGLDVTLAFDLNMTDADSR